MGMSWSLHIPMSASWSTTAGLALSAAGIGVTVILYKRAGRQYRSARDDHAQLEVGAAIEARLRSWAGAKVDVRAQGFRSHRRSGTDGQELAASTDDDELERVERALREFRPSYTEHEIAAFYESLTDEDLGISPEDLQGVA